MATRPLPEVRLFQNPYGGILDADAVIRALQSGAHAVNEAIAEMIENGEIEEGRGAFACVVLDPTRPRYQVALKDRIMAIVLFGDDAERFIPNGAAKADAHDRHGVSNGILVMDRSFCLSAGDFAYGDSADYKGAIAAGSGLSVEQDRMMAYMLVSIAMDEIREERDKFIAEQRELPAGQRWYNQSDEPGADYLAVSEMEPWITVSS